MAAWSPPNTTSTLREGREGRETGSVPVTATDTKVSHSEIEEWRPIPGYADWYEASSLGRIRRSRPANNSAVGRVLRPKRHHRGYLQVQLSKDGRARSFRVHVLVAAAFLGLPPAGKTVNHIDGVKANNAIANLEYLTNLENIRHSWAIGLRGARPAPEPSHA